MGKAIATASKTKEIIEKWNLHARKGYGQNFLIDPSAAAKIAESVSGPGAVIEIGPGIGALTEQLAMRCDVVRAYEIDGDFLPVLADTLQAYGNVQIVHQDFLKVDIDADQKSCRKTTAHCVRRGICRIILQHRYCSGCLKRRRRFP